MNNNTTELKGREFNYKYNQKIKRIVIRLHTKIRSELRGFLPSNLEKFIEALSGQTIFTESNPPF